MNFDIAHLSDLHFGNPTAHLPHSHLATALKTLLDALHSPASLLLITGDITFKGNKNGYHEAGEIIEDAILRKGMDRKNIISCPGNHDIAGQGSGDGPFSNFDAWISKIRGDKDCTFSDSAAKLISREAIDFLVLNTAYHLDHKVGKVNIADAKKQLARLDRPDLPKDQRSRIAILHHHLIPVFPQDRSTVGNAYELIELLNKYDFAAILHGHQHANLSLLLGRNRMLLSSVGSLAFQTPGFMNSAAIYRGSDGVIQSVERFGLSRDSPNGLYKLNSVEE